MTTFTTILWRNYCCIFVSIGKASSLLPFSRGTCGSVTGRRRVCCWRRSCSGSRNWALRSLFVLQRSEGDDHCTCRDHLLTMSGLNVLFQMQNSYHLVEFQGAINDNRGREKLSTADVVDKRCMVYCSYDTHIQ